MAFFLVMLALTTRVPTLHAEVTEYLDEVSFTAAAGVVNVVDFDSFPIETVLTGDEFLSLGLTITQRDCHALNVVTFDSTSPPGTSLSLVSSIPFRTL